MELAPHPPAAEHRLPPLLGLSKAVGGAMRRKSRRDRIGSVLWGGRVRCPAAPRASSTAPGRSSSATRRAISTAIPFRKPPTGPVRSLRERRSGSWLSRLRASRAASPPSSSTSAIPPRVAFGAHKTALPARGHSMQASTSARSLAGGRESRRSRRWNKTRPRHVSRIALAERRLDLPLPRRRSRPTVRSPDAGSNRSRRRECEHAGPSVRHARGGQTRKFAYPGAYRIGPERRRVGRGPLRMLNFYDFLVAAGGLEPPTPAL
jgi:hypothetical protein